MSLPSLNKVISIYLSKNDQLASCQQSLFFRLLDFRVLEKESEVKSLSSMRDTLLGYSFEPRTNRRVLAIVGSVLDHQCVNEPMLALGKKTV